MDGSIVPVDEHEIIKKITRRIIPFVMVLYTVAYVDRSVIGFAKLEMAADIGLSDTAYGLGAGLFFLGYFLFEVPSNYVMPKFGPRKWFVRILVSWGLVTMAMALAKNVPTFYALRFLLGVAEAGFYPGILYYLTLWFPQRHRTKATGTFVIAAPLAFLIMSPLAGWILGFNLLGLRGWHWLFIICGGVAVLASIPTMLWLKDGPRSAPWLAIEEADWIEAELEKDKLQLGQLEHKNSLEALKSKYVWVFAFLFFPSTVGIYGLSFWVPTVVKHFAHTDLATGWLSAIPYIFGIIGIWITSHWASGFKENWIPLTVLFAGSAIGLALAALAGSPVTQLASMAFAAFCLYSIAGVFWALPTRYLVGGSAAVGIAFINSFGNIGGFVGPYAVGAISDATGLARNGMYFLSAVLLAGAIGALVMRKLWQDKNPVDRAKSVVKAHVTG